VLDPHSVLGDSIPRPRPRRHGRQGHDRQDHVRHERETRPGHGRGGHHHGTGSDRIGGHFGRLGGHVLRHEFTSNTRGIQEGKNEKRTLTETRELCTRSHSIRTPECGMATAPWDWFDHLPLSPGHSVDVVSPDRRS
jgi:hypothetical protein